MTTDFLEAPQPIEQNTRGDNAGQMLLRDVDMTKFAGLINKELTLRDSAQTILPDIDFSDLSRSAFDASNPKAPEHLRQMQNAEKNLPELLAKSGATADGRSGLTQQDIAKLKQQRLTQEQRDALEFLEKNHDALKNGRTFLGMGADGITIDSFKRNKMDSDPVERQNPRARDRVEPKPSEDRSETKPARDFGDTKVQAWKGPWSVAEKMLQGQNLDGKSQMDLTKVLKDGAGVDWNKPVKEGTELINERNLESVRKQIEKTGNPKLVEWFNKRYPKA